MPSFAHITAADPPAHQRVMPVLILDDERFDRHRLARLCSGLPFKTDVTNTKSLVEFGAAVASQQFELVLIDYRLPDGTGLDALATIRRSARNLNAATIMISGHAKDDVAKEALRAGCADYLTKDEIAPAAFQRAVGNALQKSKLTIQIEAQTFARNEVAAVLEHFASKCARDIKPTVSRLLRQIRDLRASEDTERLSAIEATCMEMWVMMVELERHKGLEMMIQTLASAQEDDDAPQPKPLRKPPSPFSPPVQQYGALKS